MCFPRSALLSLAAVISVKSAPAMADEITPYMAIGPNLLLSPSDSSFPFGVEFDLGITPLSIFSGGFNFRTVDSRNSFGLAVHVPLFLQSFYARFEAGMLNQRGYGNTGYTSAGVSQTVNLPKVLPRGSFVSWEFNAIFPGSYGASYLLGMKYLSFFK